MSGAQRVGFEMAATVAESDSNTTRVVPGRDGEARLESSGAAGGMPFAMPFPMPYLRAMTATLTMDSAGRVVLPKGIRDKLHLVAGSKLRADIVGDKLELEVEPPETKVVTNKAGRRVIVGWEGFNAVEAIKQSRAERDAKLTGFHKKSGK